MKRIQNLNDVKKGDKFYIFARYGRKVEIVTCCNVTPQRAQIGPYRYLKKDASGYGGGTWRSPPCLYLIDKESEALYGEQILRESLKKAVSQLNFDTMPIDKATEIFELLKKHFRDLVAS